MSRPINFQVTILFAILVSLCKIRVATSGKGKGEFELRSELSGLEAVQIYKPKLTIAIYRLHALCKEAARAI